MAFLSLKNGFVLANSADPDEMPRSAAFHLSLHCLQNYPVYKSVNWSLLIQTWGRFAWLFHDHVSQGILFENV